VLKGSANIFRDNWVSHVESSILAIKTGGDKMGIGLQESQGTIVEHNYIAYSGGIDYYFEQGSAVRYNYLYRVSSSGSPHVRISASTETFITWRGCLEDLVPPASMPQPRDREPFTSSITLFSMPRHSF